MKQGVKFIELDKASTTGSSTSETEPTVIRAGNGDALLLLDRLSSESGKPPGWTAADEIGDKQPFGVSESVEPPMSEPIADKTEVGDWFSLSETDKFEDADLLGCSTAVVSLLVGTTSFLG